MRQDQFDHLTRLLAGATSRRQAIKTFVATTVASLFGGALAGQAAVVDTPSSQPQQADPTAPNPANTYEGTCVAFRDYAASTGVTDGKGNRHAGWGGAYSFDLDASLTYKAERTTRNYFNCCGPIYEDYNLCVDECFALRCITECFPLRGTVCLNTTEINVNFFVNQTVSVLYWNPPGGEKALGQGCRDDYRRYLADVNTHEHHHVEDTANVLDFYNNKWRGKRYGACGRTLQEAQEQLTAALSRDINNDKAACKAEIDAAANEYHESPGGRPITPPNCDICP